MQTAEREGGPVAAPLGAPAEPRWRRTLLALAGPTLIVVSVLVALRGFAFANLLTNQHPDILSFWLPRSCLMGRALSTTHVPLWNPFEMIGTPFAADPQSGWLYLPSMVLSWLFGCGGGLRALIVLNPILAGLGTLWFLRRERLGRVAATAGGLSVAMSIGASTVAISMPFAGTLAWTPLVLVGASGYLGAERLLHRLPWLALAAFAWGQVASAHLSHGLVMCSGLAFAYVVARLVQQVRAGRSRWPKALALGAGFFAFLPLASLAILVPRFALISRSSLRAGYGALEGTLARAAGVEDRPIPDRGIWSGWPFALASAPGAYVGATMLLLAPMAFRDARRRAVALAFGVTAVVSYLATITLLVGTTWLRDLVLRLPFGDVYLHNPGRLRYLAFLVVPVLGALGLQSLLERPPSAREVRWWIGGALAVVLALPLALGARPVRFVLFVLGAAAFAFAVRAVLRRRRHAALALVGVLTAELLAGAIWSSTYQGGTIYLGLEGRDHPALIHGPLKWPDVPLDRYLTPGPIAQQIATSGIGDGRYVAWIQPTVYFNKGYLFTQAPTDWPALLLGRAIVFRLPDVLGYSPIQLPRYWSYIRATDQLPVFYNASVLQAPSEEDVRLLGIRYMIVPEGVTPPIAARPLLTERGDTLVEVQGWERRVSVVPAWRSVSSGVPALESVLTRGFDPATEAIVEGNPGLEPSPALGAVEGIATSTYRETRPEDVRVTVDTPTNAIVVIRNAWDRGWSATVDGEPAPVLRADYLLQGVPVPAGRHEIRLEYREPAIARGIAGSVVVWLALLALAGGLALVELRRRSPRRDA
ncbi:MAG: YfhO family protein [Solirubrobacterales bacterium]